jgi:hypothetical protein
MINNDTIRIYAFWAAYIAGLWAVKGAIWLAKRARPWVALALIAYGITACTPAKAPSAHDIAVTAINVTDAALTIAIMSSTADAGADPAFERDVNALQLAADVVRAGVTFCLVADDVARVAADADCTQCAAPIKAAKEAFKCP